MRAQALTAELRDRLAALFRTGDIMPDTDMTPIPGLPVFTGTSRRARQRHPGLRPGQPGPRVQPVRRPA